MRRIAHAEYNVHTSLFFKNKDSNLNVIFNIFYIYTCLSQSRRIKNSPARRENTRNQIEIRQSFQRLTMCYQAVS